MDCEPACAIWAEAPLCLVSAGGRVALCKVVCLDQEFCEYPCGLDTGQPQVKSLKADGKAVVIEAEEVEHGGVNIADVSGFSDRPKT